MWLQPPSFWVGALQLGQALEILRMARLLAISSLRVRRAYCPHVSEGGWALLCRKQKAVEHASHTMAGRLASPSSSLWQASFGHSLHTQRRGGSGTVLAPGLAIAPPPRPTCSWRCSSWP